MSQVFHFQNIIHGQNDQQKVLPLATRTQIMLVNRSFRALNQFKLAFRGSEITTSPHPLQAYHIYSSKKHTQAKVCFPKFLYIRLMISLAFSRRPLSTNITNQKRSLLRTPLCHGVVALHPRVSNLQGHRPSVKRWRC